MTEPPEPPAKDNSDKPKRKLGQKRAIRITISDDLNATLRVEAQRTAVGTSRLLHRAKDKPAGLTGSMINGWINGLTQTARLDHVIYVLKRWAEMPDNQRMPFTPDMRAMLDDEFIRTGTGPSTVLRNAMDCPAGLTSGILKCLLNGSINTISATHWDFVLARLRSLPDSAPGFLSSLHRRRMVNPITDSDMMELRRLRDEIGIGGDVLLGCATDTPPGLTPVMINNWVAGTVRTAIPEHIAYVLARYRAWPTSELRRIDSRDLAEIREHSERTRIGGVILLRNAPDLPAGLTPPVISQWLSGVSLSARPEHVAFVLARYRNWPSDQPSTGPSAAPTSPRAKIEESALAELRHHRNRTGIGGSVLLRTATDKPKGLTPEMIIGWLSGATMSARPEYVEYVLARYRNWP